MRIFKFGGASTKDAAAVKNMANIIKESREEGEKLIIVISAMGKITNALEQLVNSYFYKKDGMLADYSSVKEYHLQILNALFDDKNHQVFSRFDTVMSELFGYIHKETRREYDEEYDKIVPYGELLSTIIVSAYLNAIGITNRWVDARNLIHTDSMFRDARIDWIQTTWKVKGFFDSPKNEDSLFVTQGFIGQDFDNNTTTLGREGSDFTAAILAHCLNAKDVTIWKDVPGLLNCDPRYFKDPILLKTISYAEAIELTYYGASIIHPKTIKPLQNKNIPLRVKSFVDYKADGSLVSDKYTKEDKVPCFILKQNQAIISIASTDFSFIAVDHLHNIFGIFNKYAVKIRLMQNSAISFSVCVDYDEMRLKRIIDELKGTYSVKYNTKLELITIRHYDDDVINKMVKNKKVLMEQRSRLTAQIVFSA